MSNIYHLAHFDPARKLLLRLTEWQKERDAQAALTAKAAEQERYRAAYAKRRAPNNEPPSAA